MLSLIVLCEDGRNASEVKILVIDGEKTSDAGEKNCKVNSVRWV